MDIKVGFIGTGGIAKEHIEILSKIENVSLEAFCDIDEQKAKMYAQRFNGRPYNDYHQMLDKEKLDVLYICLPPFAHTDQEIIASKKGINMFVEKPVVLTMDKAREIESAILKSKIICSVGYCCRYLDVAERMKELIKNRKIAMIFGRFHSGFVEVPWWRIRAKSGGQLVEQSTHIVDMIRYLVGEVDSVYGRAIRGINQYENYDIDDASMITVQFKNGSIGTISSSCIGKDRGADGTGIEIFLRGMEIHLLGWSKLRVFSDGKIVEETNSQCNMYELEDKAFIEAVKKRDQSLVKSSYSDAMKTLELTLAMEESIKKNKEISI